jgi:pSer/pThr/pTyr-binding forkhead associated (FHA) protein
MSIKCPQCNYDNDDKGQFCSRCGSKLDGRMDSTMSFNLSLDVGEDTQLDLEKLSKEGPLLIVVKGIGVGQTFALEKEEVSIGRDPDNDIFLDDVTVSRRHAAIRNASGKFEISDTGSLNGTYVNRKRVEKVVMTEGDELQIGKFRMIFFGRHGAKNGN